MNQPKLQNNPLRYQVRAGALSSRTAQIFSRPNVQLEHYVQMLEQELDSARTKIQEYETTTNLLCQTSLVRNHNQNARRAFAPYIFSNPSFRDENTGVFSSNYSPRFDRLPPPSRLGTHRLSSLDSDFAKRQRDLTDGPSELPRKKARHTSSTQPNSVFEIPPPPKPYSHSTSTDFDGALTSSRSNRPDWSVEYNPEVDRTIEMKLIHTISDELGAFRVKFSPDGLLLAVVARWSQVVTIYNVATGAKICLLEDLYIWEVGKKHVRNVLKGHLNGGIFCLHFSPDGRFLISGSDDKTVRIWNMRDGSSRVFNISDSCIRTVRFSPDGRRVAAGSWHGEVLIWDMPSGHLVASWKRHTAVVTSIVFMPNGEGLISGSWDRSLRYWDISGSTLARMSDEKGHGAVDAESLAFVGQTNRIRSISISPHGRWLASRSNDHTVRIWNTHTGSQQCSLQPHEGEVYSVDFSPAGGHFASASEDGQVRIWSCKQQV